MKNRPPTQKQQRASDDAYRQIDDRYVSDASKGIYTPKPYYEKEKRQNKNANRRWLTVALRNCQKQLIPIIISGLTLFVVGVYTYLAREQRREAFRANNIAQAALYEVHEQKRPWVGIIEKNLSVRQTANKLDISYRAKNYGDIPARRVRAAYRLLVNDIDMWSGSNLCGPDPDLGARDPTKPAATIFQGAETESGTVPTEPIMPLPQDTWNSAKRHWVVICIAYHSYGAQYSYGTATIYSLETKHVFNVEHYKND